MVSERAIRAAGWTRPSGWRWSARQHDRSRTVGVVRPLLRQQVVDPVEQARQLLVRLGRVHAQISGEEGACPVEALEPAGERHADRLQHREIELLAAVSARDALAGKALSLS